MCIVGFFIIVFGGSAEAARCPMRFDAGNLHLRLEVVGVFNGPTQNLASLIGAGDYWDRLQFIDPYVECVYGRWQKTSATVVLHVKGASICVRHWHPLRLSCR